MTSRTSDTRPAEAADRPSGTAPRRLGWLAELPPARRWWALGGAAAALVVTAVVVAAVLAGRPDAAATFSAGQPADAPAAVETPAGPSAPPPVGQERSAPAGANEARPGSPLAAFEDAYRRAVADGRVGAAASERIDARLGPLRAAVAGGGDVADAVADVRAELSRLRVGRDTDAPTRKELLGLLAGIGNRAGR
jgi:hypothetical protein